MSNPNPDLITDPMWKLWTDRPNKAWKLGGIYANKSGYHNTVHANLKNWPSNYSVRLPLDLVAFNRDKARAIDLTMSTTEMIKITSRMNVAATTPGDTRLRAVREFYGTLDGKEVFGLSKNSSSGPWRRVSADKTHRWHLHMSLLTAFINDWLMLAPILSVWKGETLRDWRNKSMNLPEQGDSGESVKFWQYIHNVVRGTVSPNAPIVDMDGVYDAKTAAAFLDFWKKRGGTGNTYKGGFMTAWLATQYLAAYARHSAPQPPVASPDQIKVVVNEWLDQNIAGKNLKFTGKIEGDVTPA